MSLVYAVTDGEYSDYKVIGVYSTQKRAEYAHRLYRADNEIEVWVVDELPEHPRNHLMFEVQMARDGEVVRIRQGSPGRGVVGIESASNYGSVRVRENLAFDVWAKDEKHAIKIVNEYRGRMLADGMWDLVAEMRDWPNAIRYLEIQALIEAGEVVPPPTATTPGGTFQGLDQLFTGFEDEHDPD